MVTRLLNNLKGVYSNVDDTVRCLAAVERLLIIHPTSPTELRARGVLPAQLGRLTDAADQLEEYISGSPQAPDAGRILGAIRDLRDGKDATDRLGGA